MLASSFVQLYKFVPIYLLIQTPLPYIDTSQPQITTPEFTI